jgi:hypothetical protein
MRKVILTCETDGCQNKDVAIEVETDATQYMCGACLTLISNAVEVTNGTPEETE